MKFVFILLALFCLPSTASAATPGEVPVGGILRDGVLYDFVGDYARLSEWRGKPLIINVWASWCAPCRAEMGSLDRLSVNYGGDKFKVIGISTDDYSNRAMAFLLKSGVHFDNFLDRKLKWENMLGANRLPLTLLIDAEGRVLKKVYGSRQWDSANSLQFISRAFNIQLQTSPSR